MDKVTTLDRAKDLRDDDLLDESLEMLLSLLEEHPDDPQVLFEVGGIYDLMDSANEAIPYYHRAIDLGLKGPDLQECYICFGICQRAVGDYPESLETLEEAAELFPRDNSIKVFLAMTLYSNKRSHDAVKLLGRLYLVDARQVVRRERNKRALPELDLFDIAHVLVPVPLVLYGLESD